jgi:bacillithiol biosynthesis cysteine-adding enzyme BshC
MILENEELAAAFARGRSRVAGLGFEPQVEKDPEAANLYLYRGDERIPLYRREPGRFALGSGADTETLTRDELLETAKLRPERLSPNVVLRPLVQEVAFPLLAYLGGPGETSYFGLYRELFQRLGRTMPIIYPRPTVTIIERAMARHLEKSGLLPEDTLDLGRLGEARARHLAETDPVGIDEVFDRLVAALEEEHGRATGTVARIAPSLRELAEKNRERILAEVEWLRKKTWQQHRQNCRDAVGRFDAIETSLRPRGDYQERVFNIFPYLAKYGPDLAHDLTGVNLVPPGAAVDPRHRLIWL